MKRLQLDKRDGIGFIALDDGKANAIQEELLTQLDVALESCERDPDLRAVVLSGRDGFFSAGMDLKLTPTLPDPELRTVLQHLAETSLRLFTFPKPLVAALTGHAVAGGSVFALCVDVHVTTDGTYRIGLSEVAIGIPLPTFILEIAREALPAVAITPVCLHGQLVGPEDALRTGIVNEIAPLAEVRERAAAQARRLAQLKPAAYQSTKRRLRQAATIRSREAFSAEAEEFMRAFRTTSAAR